MDLVNARVLARRQVRRHVSDDRRHELGHLGGVAEEDDLGLRSDELVVGDDAKDVR
jgi:hypothetical protein